MWQPLVPAGPAEEGGPAPTDDAGNTVLVAWSPPAALAERLVTRPCDLSGQPAVRLEREWGSDGAAGGGGGGGRLAAVLAAVLETRRHRLDGTLPPERLVASALRALGFERCPVVVPPRPLPAAAAAAAADPAATLWSVLAALAAEGGAGDEESGGAWGGGRMASLWGELCPVALRDAAEMRRGAPALAVDYCGRVRLQRGAGHTQCGRAKRQARPARADAPSGALSRGEPGCRLCIVRAARRAGSPPAPPRPQSRSTPRVRRAAASGAPRPSRSAAQRDRALGAGRVRGASGGAGSAAEQPVGPAPLHRQPQGSAPPRPLTRARACARAHTHTHARARARHI